MTTIRPIGSSAPMGRRLFEDAGNLVRKHTANGQVNIDRLAADLGQQTGADGAALRQAVDAQLTPVQRGQLAARGAPGADKAALAADLAQVALDIVGIFEPTPFADLANTGISLLRRDFAGAGMSALGVVPYLGDLAKVGKLGRWAKAVSDGVDAALTNSAARKALEPGLKKIAAAIDAIPAAALAKAPPAVRETIEGLRSQLRRLTDDVAAVVAKGVQASARRLGVPESRIKGILDMPVGQRPPVHTYMTASQRAAHLAAFDDGIVRVTSRSAVSQYGTLGPPGGFVTSARDFKAIMADAKGDLRIVETRLGLTPGSLGDKDTLVAVIDPRDAKDLRIPSGNESGANERWIPGGYTSGNTIEAVMDFPPGMKYGEIQYDRK